MEARTPPRYAAFFPSARHQLLRIAPEKLREDHGIALGRETLRQWMIEAGLWRDRKQRKRIHQPRPRRDCVGELVQVDGSEHWWFEDRGPQCTLLVFVDDATGRLMHLQFVERESTFAYFHAARTYLEAWGSEQAKPAIGKRVTVVDYPDGRLAVRYRGIELAYRTHAGAISTTRVSLRPCSQHRGLPAFAGRWHKPRDRVWAPHCRAIATPGFGISCGVWAAVFACRNTAGFETPQNTARSDSDFPWDLYKVAVFAVFAVFR